MIRKQSEAEWANMMHRYNIWNKKWRDVSYCPNCHKPIFMTTRTSTQDARTQPESIVDYEIIVGNEVAWVECKQAGDLFSFTDKSTGINPKQRAFMDSWTDRKVICWLFLVMGTGKPQNYGRQAWLISWRDWQTQEMILEQQGFKSICYEPNKLPKRDYLNARVMLRDFHLNWEPKVGWVFPEDHRFLITYPQIATLPPLYEENKDAKLTT